MRNIAYNSVFCKEFTDLIILKRSVGFKYEAEADGFKRLDSYFCQIGLKEKKLTKEVCDNWCKKRSYEAENNRSHRISLLRVFCKYLKSIGISAYIPPEGLTSHGPRYEAHIYTDDEIKRFFEAVDKSQSVPKECPYRSLVMPVFFRILYTSGMRVSELRLARVKDVNLEEGYIVVRQGKNNKDRIVPFNPSLVEKCKEIKSAIHSQSSEDEYFFVIRPGEEMTLQNLYRNFRRYLEQAGISHTGKGPRIHDFRHTYCVNLLRRWAEEDKDLLACLPYMRVMLGHETFEETSYYLKLTAAEFPLIRKKLDEAFPNIVEEVSIHGHEYY